MDGTPKVTAVDEAESETGRHIHAVAEPEPQAQLQAADRDAAEADGVNASSRADTPTEGVHEPQPATTSERHVPS